jgi:hypothetical protein
VKYFANLPTVLIFAGLASSCTAPPDTKHMDSVHYSDFDIDPIIGYHEGDIERHSCSFKIDHTKFKGALGKSSNTYDENNVRAKLTDIYGDVYFIDANGTVKTDGKYYSIGKEFFTSNLVNRGNCT